MESWEEVAVAVGSYSGNGSSGVECDYAAAVASFTKRKRTKRLRTSSSSSPLPPPPPPEDEEEEEEEEEEDYFSTSSTTEEEEDMAHCLILLAQGRTTACPSSSPAPLAPREEKFTSRKFAEATTTATGAKAGFYVYECKTCNKCFPSFQALGGHRASHKKPKLQGAAAAAASTAAETTLAVKAADIDHHDGHGRLEAISSTMNSSSFAAGTAPAPNNKLCRVHECSICGSEFASGQALGGHMRRHRPVGAVFAAVAPESPREEAVINSTSSSPCKEEEDQKKKKKRKKCMLSLDLNLPAPSEDQNVSNPMAAVMFAGFTDQHPLALVDCHY